MIVFDLRCGSGHVFEAWFGSTADYEQQRARGLVSCPMCDSKEVDKALMAPAVSTGGPLPSPEMVKAVLGAMARMQGEMLRGSTNVGARFASEARAIHAGDAEVRAIHGRATREEARDLIEDGVPVAPLPLPVVDPDDSN